MTFEWTSEYRGSAYLAHGGSPKGVANEQKSSLPCLFATRKDLIDVRGCFKFKILCIRPIKRCM